MHIAHRLMKFDFCFDVILLRWWALVAMTSFHEKAHGSVFSNRIRLNLGLVVLQVDRYSSTDGVSFSISCHAFKMAAKTSFHAEKCCHLVSAHAVSIQRYHFCLQFLIYSTFKLVC